MGGSSSTLSIIVQLVDQATAALQGMSQSTEKALKDIQSQADEVRNSFGLLGGAIIGGLGVLVDTAANADTAQSQLTTAINAGIASANEDSNSTGVLAKEKANLQQQLAGVNAKLSEYQDKLTSGSAASGGYADTIATLQTKAQGLQEQLTDVTNALSLTGASTAMIAAQFEQAAQANTQLGFTVEDSLASYTQLFRATDSVSESMQANSVAMDLARASGMDLADAAKQVELAMEGNGRALKQYGINLKDGLSPGEALAELQQKLAGTAQDYVNTPWGQLDVAKAKTQELSATLGNELIPVLLNFLQVVTPIITKITEWADAHPKLTTDILLAVGAVGLLALGIAAIAGIISAGITVFLGLSTVVSALGAIIPVVGAVIAALGWPITLIIVAVALLAAVIFTHWNQIIDWTSNMMLTVAGAWNKGWQAMSDFLGGILNGIKTAVQDASNFVMGLVNSMMAAINSVKSAASSIGNAVGNVTGAVGGAVNNVVHAFAEGGIVTGPTFALVGEAGPEAIIPLSAFAGGNTLAGSGAGGSGGIVINITGNTISSQLDMRNLAQTVGAEIVRVLRLNQKLSI